jgi:hypothetical protein
VALLYDGSTITPSKLELLKAWLPGQPWLAGADTSELTAVGAYRFDDPAGEVGIETHLLRSANGRLLQIPVTYRSAPIADAALVGTTEHSTLGQRWVYDATGDPVYVSALARTILTGGRQAALELASGGQREPTTRVRGSGAPGTPVPQLRAVEVRDAAGATHMSAAELTLVLRRVLDLPLDAGGAASLHGTWPGQDEPAVLAVVGRSVA